MENRKLILNIYYHVSNWQFLQISISGMVLAEEQEKSGMIEAQSWQADGCGGNERHCMCVVVYFECTVIQFYKMPMNYIEKIKAK